MIDLIEIKTSHICKNCNYSGDDFESLFQKINDEILYQKIKCPNCKFEEKYKNEALYKIMEYCEFEYGECYILSIMARKKNNDDLKKANQLIRRKQIHNIDELVEGYTYLKNRALSDSEHVYYMYLSVNSRSIKKALTIYTKILLDIMTNLEDTCTMERTKKIPSLWYSCLEKDSSRGKSRYYMIDLDTKDENILERVLNYLDNTVYVKLINPTKNGYHIIINPIDVMKFNQDLMDLKTEKLIELKKDALTFVEVING